MPLKVGTRPSSAKKHVHKWQFDPWGDLGRPPTGAGSGTKTPATLQKTGVDELFKVLEPALVTGAEFDSDTESISERSRSNKEQCESTVCCTTSGRPLSVPQQCLTPSWRGAWGRTISAFILSQVFQWLPVSALPPARRVCAPFRAAVCLILSGNALIASALEAHIMSVLRGQDQRVWVAVRERCAPVTGGCCKFQQNRVDLQGLARGSREPESLSFFFDAAFSGGATQTAVWGRLQPPLMRCILRREHACVLAYGQTGSGKTHTMFGNLQAANGAGIVFRAVHDLAEIVQQWQQPEAPPAIELSFVEVYNEKVYDLFAERRVCAVSAGVAKDATRRRCSPLELEQQIAGWIREGSATRTSGQTVLNAESSRSHALVTLHVRWQAQEPDGAEEERRLYFVDLAGSERAGAYALSAAQLREGVNINKSLSTLARVVGTLARGQGTHVPVRDSVLTVLLSDAITGRTARAFMVATVHPDHPAETLSTLCYAREYSSLRSNLGRELLQATSSVRRMQRLLTTARADFERACADGAGQLQGMPPWTSDTLRNTRIVRTRHRVRDDFHRHPCLSWTDAHECKRSIAAVGIVQQEVDGPPPPRERGEPKDGRKRRKRRLAAAAAAAEHQEARDAATAPDPGFRGRVVQVTYPGRHGRPAQVLWYPARSLRDVPLPTHLTELADKVEELKRSLDAKQEQLAELKRTFLRQQQQLMGHVGREGEEVALA